MRMRHAPPRKVAVCFAMASVMVTATGCSADDEVSVAPEAIPDAAVEHAETAPSRMIEDAATPLNDAGVVDAADAPVLDVPASLVTALGDKTYVEESCQPSTYPGWPFPAQKCTYRNGLVVTIANPLADRVARWIVDAATLISALDALKVSDRARWEEGLTVIAMHTIHQSSRIFPLEGKVWEDGTAYTFERGVTKTCSSGCYCRVNSTSRPQWCSYAAQVLGTEVESSCLSKYGQAAKTLTDAWLAHCFDNHVAAWNADRNEHYRAQAWAANRALGVKFPSPSAASGTAVIAALKLEYP